MRRRAEELQVETELEGGGPSPAQSWCNLDVESGAAQCLGEGLQRRRVVADDQNAKRGHESDPRLGCHRVDR
jgi:hypothetical protein